jgi:hypothetical protein
MFYITYMQLLKNDRSSISLTIIKGKFIEVSMIFNAKLHIGLTIHQTCNYNSYMFVAELIGLT